MSKPVNAKINVTGASGNALERFCEMYHGRVGGKSELVNELLSAGVVLKEAGLLDMILNLDQDPAFRSAPNTVKTRRVVGELSELFSMMAPVQAVPAQTAAVVTPAPEAMQPMPEVKAPVSVEAVEQAAAAVAKQPPAQPNPAIPDFSS
ncbi:hypothetical protein JCM19237_277 [Photobacterium aphoticum]|uniref:Uncharacterized protein n=1 Tax=Photobacterium aphoticum TaxID=754436 RepID=A0A090RK77_9GAMM|nr:hypothetical protein JCM19237_277 [Photobacterium aphoticum]